VITAEYPFRTLNDAVVHVNTSFARGYAGAAESAKAAAEAEHGAQSPDQVAAAKAEH
jgi:hypothetical protein